MFRHGDLATDVSGIKKSFDDHFDFYRQRMGRMPETCLELGPGDSLGHALLAKSCGVRECWFVDVGDFATRDPAHYRALWDYLAGQGLKFPAMPVDFDRDTVLGYANGHYGTAGLASLREVPAGSLDFSFSHAVLEHVRRAEFAGHMRELYRAHRPGSLSRHWVDLHDHLGGALNSFRFPAAFWESRWVQEAGFYTNRLTMAEMIAAARQAGFAVEIQRLIKWETLPTPRQAMHRDFAALTAEDLNVCTFLMVLTKG